MDTIRLDLNEIKRKIALQEPVLTVTAGESYSIELYKSPEYVPYYIEVGDTHFRFNSAVFLPNVQDQQRPGNAEGTFSTGISLVEKIYFIISLTEGHLLVTGHTDTVGDVTKNTKLSEYRAAAVYSLITGDRELFKTVSDAPHITDKEKKAQTLIHDQLQICDWVAAEFGWPCSHKENQFDFIKTFKAFQSSYNKYNFCDNPSGEAIDVDGSWGPQTWGAAFDCYEAKLARRLMIKRQELESYRNKLRIKDRFVLSNKQYVGCGEYHPIDAVQNDNYNSKTNRRVEILFFKPGEIPVCSCVNQECNGADCELYKSIQSVRGKKIEARWSEPLVLAGHCDCRKMTFVAPDHDGVTVRFEPYIISNGAFTRIEPVNECTVVGANASCTFDETNESVTKYIKEDMSECGHSYFFLARNDELTVVSARLHAATDSGIHI